MKLFHKFLISILSLPTMVMPILTTSCNNNSTSDPRPHMLDYSITYQMDPDYCDATITFDKEIKECYISSWHKPKATISKNVLTLKNSTTGARVTFTVTDTNGNKRDLYWTWEWSKPTITEAK